MSFKNTFNDASSSLLLLDKVVVRCHEMINELERRLKEFSVLFLFVKYYYIIWWSCN